MNVLLWDDCDDALLGLGGQYPAAPVAVYDYDRLVDVFIAQGMDRDEAVEHIEFNIACAYIGPGTPILVRSMTREEMELELEDDGELEEPALEEPAP
jgi:hypothetical protein